MTQQYLLFDSSCAVCTRLAEEIERASDVWLTARSLRDPDVQTLLDAAKPGWRWEPMLLEVTDGRPRVFTGIAMRARMALGLGPRRAWRVLQVVQRAIVPQSVHAPVPTARRRFLQRTGTFAGLLFIPRLNKNHLTPQSSTALRILSADEIATVLPTVIASDSYLQFLSQLGADAAPEQAFALGRGENAVVTVPFTYKGKPQGAFFSAGLHSNVASPPDLHGTVALSREAVSGGNRVMVWHNRTSVMNATLDDQGTIIQGWVLRDGKRAAIARQNFTAQGQAQLDAALREFAGVINSHQSTQFSSLQSSQSCYDTCNSRCGVPRDIAATALALCGAACTVGIGCPCAIVAAGAYGYYVSCCLFKCYITATVCCGY